MNFKPIGKMMSALQSFLPLLSCLNGQKMNMNLTYAELLKRSNHGHKAIK